MKRKYDIVSVALLLLVSGGCIQSCQDEVPDIRIPDRETLIAEGKYLSARGGDEFREVDPTDGEDPFPVGTPYRLLSFSKAYVETDFKNETPAKHLRFNKVAWEGDAGGIRYFNIDGNPDKWFGFSALDGEEEIAGNNGLVSLDYYGFTYGKAEEVKDNYIELETVDGKLPELEKIKRTEVIGTNGVLADLMRGELLNQNIMTAGKSKDDEGNLTDNRYAQSIMRFRHCFSKLHFQVSQQGSEEDPDKPVFTDLKLDKIEVTNTYSEGSVYLQSGKVEINTGSKRDTLGLAFNSKFNGDVTVRNSDVGEMLVFPSDGNSLINMPEGMKEGYDIGLKITVRSTVKEDIENMLKNTESTGEISDETDADGKKWYKGVIVKPIIPDYYNSANPLRLRQDAAYMFIITFQKDAVRIITVIPQVEEWLNGEGSLETPWETQYLGHPQMFDNVVWNDRNLGADHYDPTAEYEMTMGYFYQAGRNIPYYPFNPNDPKEVEEVDGVKIPIFSMMNKQGLSNKVTDWGPEDNKSQYRFFPIVDEKIRNMSGSPNWTIYNYDVKDKGVAGNPQMYIPETKPVDYYFDFLRTTGGNENGLKDTLGQDMYWERGGSKHHPISGAWMVPTSKQFLSIFPSTPHAGNIAMLNGGNNTTPMIWGAAGTSKQIDTSICKTLRVTVPFYTPGMMESEIHEAKKNDTAYMKAWRTLNTYENDPNDKSLGTTHLNEYYSGWGPDAKQNKEVDMNGDPEDGFASVYVISREEGSEYSLDGYIKDKEDDGGEFVIRKWGTIYAIKRAYTPQAYRMRWRALIAKKGTRNPCIYIEICRYRCNSTDVLTETNYDDYDWDHPAATLYFPICGLGDHTGQYINFGTECQYATSDDIIMGETSAVQIKITGNNMVNAYIAVVKGKINRNFGMQIRPVASGGGGK